MQYMYIRMLVQENCHTNRRTYVRLHERSQDVAEPCEVSKHLVLLQAELLLIKKHRVTLFYTENNALVHDTNGALQQNMSIYMIHRQEVNVHV